MEIASNQETSEAVGQSIRQSVGLLEGKNVYMAENSNIPAVSNCKRVYVTKNMLLERTGNVLSQEAKAVIGTGAAFAAQDRIQAVKSQK